MANKKQRAEQIDIEELKRIAKEAGRATLEIYKKDFDVQYKYDHDNDDSPLTQADLKSNEIITNNLKELSNIPILSEETEQLPYQKRKDWDKFWLIDPLDGTKEFVKKNGEFTINIALIKNNKPIRGVVYIPVEDTFYYTKGEKAFKQIKNNEPKEISNKESIEDKDKIIVVASKSHFNKETKEYIESLGKEYELIRKGSSLKLCSVAEGKADIYPRLGPTMEWDTGASHAVVKNAGKNVYRFENNKIGHELTYNKENLKNPFFVVK